MRGQMYDMYLTVDVEGVGQGLLSLPILAECKLPTVNLITESLSFGTCFMRYPYSKTLVLRNDSDLRGIVLGFSITGLVPL
jgi:hydrocephalus-inducing protein